jgi:hypothetical protein
MNEDTNKKIAQALGLDPIPPKQESPIAAEELKESDGPTKLEILKDKPMEEVIIDEDFNEARENLKDILSKTNAAVEKLATVAEESESARHYEVLAQMLRHAGDLNDKLLNLSKQRKELTKGLPGQQRVVQAPVPTPQPTGQNIAIENAVFVGTTADLDALLEKRRQEKAQQQEKQIDVVPPTSAV